MEASKSKCYNFKIMLQLQNPNVTTFLWEDQNLLAMWQKQILIINKVLKNRNLNFYFCSSIEVCSDNVFMYRQSIYQSSCGNIKS